MKLFVEAAGRFGKGFWESLWRGFVAALFSDCGGGGASYAAAATGVIVMVGPLAAATETMAELTRGNGNLLP
jgi:hypothetical protein